MRLCKSRFVSSYYGVTADSLRYTQQDMVVVIVGSEKKRYSLFKDLLCEKSTYFATALKKCWNGDKTEIILDKAEPDEFEVVVDWIYYGELPKYWFGDAIKDEFGVVERTPSLYKLADELVILQLQNDTVDALLQTNDRRIVVNNVLGVARIAQKELTHTPLYELVLRNAVTSFVTTAKGSIHTACTMLTGYPEVLEVFSLELQEYQRQPWEGIKPEESSEYHIKENPVSETRLEPDQ